MATEYEGATGPEPQADATGLTPTRPPLGFAAGGRKSDARPTGFEVRIVPDTVAVDLTPRPSVPRNKQPGSLYHHVRPRPGTLVSLTSLDDKVRLVRLTARGAPDATGWRDRWARWTYAVRQVPELLGGDAVSAQDVLDDGRGALTLLLLPGERREATLEFDVALDGQTGCGDYLFDVIAEDAANAEQDTTTGWLRLRHPGSSLLNYLPALYRERCTSCGMVEGFRPGGKMFAPYEEPPFFERFLLGFEDAQRPLRDTLDTLQSFFDPRLAPPDFLPWLSNWAALVLDENWPEIKRRALIREAVDLYRWRGTRRGLSRYLEIYTGVTPEINDQPFSGMRLASSTLLGRDTTLGDVPPHTFVVTLAVRDLSEINEQVVRDIIESEKPAHAGYALRIVPRAAGGGALTVADAPERTAPTGGE